jgi:hypothetical protein
MVRRRISLVPLFSTLWFSSLLFGAPQNPAPDKDLSVIIGSSTSSDTPTGYDRLGNGILLPQESKEYPVELPGGVSEFVLDVRGLDRNPTKLVGSIELLRPDGQSAGVSPNRFDEMSLGLRSGLGVRVPRPDKARVRIINQGPKPVEFWFYQLRGAFTGVPPLFGSVVPTGVMPGKARSGDIAPGQALYFRTLFSKGRNTLICDVRRAQTATLGTLNASLAVLNPHGWSQYFQGERINESDREYRFGERIKSEEPEYSVLKLTNEGKSLLLASWLGPLRRFKLAHLKALMVKRIEFCSAGA